MTTEEIKKELLTMARDRLFGAGPWTTEDPGVNRAMQAKLIALGLEYEDNGNICCTKLGAQLSVDLWTAFLGHHDPAEIPAILNRYGFVTSDEELEIAYRFEDGESIEALVYPRVCDAFKKYSTETSA